MLFEPLFAHAKDKPQDVAIVDDRGQYTWQQLAAMSAGLGMYLSFQTKKPTVGFSRRPTGGQGGKGTGLMNIVKRAAYIDGSCQINSFPGKGTTVLLKIPY